MFWRFLLKLILANVLVFVVFAVLFTALAGPLVLATKTAKNESAKSGMSFVVILLLAAFQIYFWAGWSAFCALLAHRYTDHASVSADWIYWIVSFFACIAPLSQYAKREAHSGLGNPDEGQDRSGCLYPPVAVAAFLTFAFWPAGAAQPFGWFLRILV